MGVAFDATDAQYLAFPAAAVNRVANTTPATFAAWVMVPTLTPDSGETQYVADSLGNDSWSPVNDGGLFLGFSEQGSGAVYPMFGIWWDDGEGPYIDTFTGSGALTPGDTVHLCVTGTEDTVTLYVNGVEDTANSQTGQYGPSPTNAPVFLVGSELASGSAQYYYTGTVADLRVYSRALSADEIATLAAERGATVLLEDSEGWWPMVGVDGADASAASAVEDISGNARHSDYGAGTVDVPRWAAVALRTVV